jgi:hypothetical protein
VDVVPGGNASTDVGGLTDAGFEYTTAHRAPEKLAIGADVDASLVETAGKASSAVLGASAIDSEILAAA